MKIQSNRAATLSRLYLINCLIIILQLIICPLWGQDIKKKELTAADYHLWGNVDIQMVSPSEEWVAYSMEYLNGIDTLFIRNINNNKTYNFCKGKNAIFTPHNGFVCLVNENLHILDLSTGKQDTISNVSQFLYSKETDNLIILSNKTDDKGLVIKTPFQKTQNKFQNVNDFWLSPDGHTLAYSTNINDKNTLSLMDLKKANSTQSIVSDHSTKFTGLSWQKKGKSLAFFSQGTKRSLTCLYFFKIKNDKLFSLNHAKFSKENDSNAFVNSPIYKLIISDDETSVFFAFNNIVAVKNSQVTDSPEIWNSDDKWIFSHEQKLRFQRMTKIAIWNTELDRIVPISTNEMPSVMITGDFRYAILSNPKAYEPQFKRIGLRDYFLLDLQTFKRYLFLEKFSGEAKHIIPSPNGKYIAYFKDDNWWVYNIMTKSHINITISLGKKFTSKELYFESNSVSGNPGWSSDDNEILLYDQYDLWSIKPDGSLAKRLTHGYEAKIKYRIARISNINQLRLVYDGYSIETFNLAQGLFLIGKGEDGKTGFFYWNSRLLEQPIIYSDNYIDQLFYGDNKKHFFYRQQNFDQAPQINVKKISSIAQVIYQSNPHQKQYYWGKSELIEYQNSNKEILKGVLLYPANFDPNKKYPMIVSIYEVQSSYLHYYNNPSSFDEVGFNNSIFTSLGYFVLLPDIVHKDGDVGISSTDCVVAATKKVIERGLVDPDRIGLIGHSFGGYETSFIITQTNIFKTAVAGAAITDLKSHYLTIGEDNGLSDMWRFETIQYRMNKTPFEASADYDRNSPVANAEKIKTPILIWSGKQDGNVSVNQSIEYYLALRRLGKKNIMLLYPKEGHILNDPKNQKDLSDRIQQWFGYYLKGEKPKEWIIKGSM